MSKIYKKFSTIKSVSMFESIIVEMPNTPNKIKFNVEWNEGYPDTFYFPKNDETEGYFQLYLKAVNLEPIEGFPKPYWNLNFLLSPFNFENESQV